MIGQQHAIGEQHVIGQQHSVCREEFVDNPGDLFPSEVDGSELLSGGGGGAIMLRL